jgi:hypothetical protein
MAWADTAFLISKIFLIGRKAAINNALAIWRLLIKVQL